MIMCESFMQGNTALHNAAAEKVSYTKFWCIKTLISTSGGRFPRATSQLRANRMLVMKALRQDVAVLAFHPQTPLPAGSSLGTAITRPTKKTCCFPAGVAALRSNQLDLLITCSFSVAYFIIFLSIWFAMCGFSICLSRRCENI